MNDTSYDRLYQESSEASSISGLLAPFPYFGGKQAISSLVWQRFGEVQNYVEPFFGSGAILLASPRVAIHETVNDISGFVSNFWRAASVDPDAVADAADWIVDECSLHARHAWLVQRQDDLVARLMGDPDYYDAVMAGRWLWGICQWIGSGWCSGKGPWRVRDDGRLVDSRDAVVWRQLPHLGDAGRGINRGIERKRPNLSNSGKGINRQLPEPGIKRQLPLLSGSQGINRQLPGGNTCAEWTAHLHDMMAALRDRMRRVRVCCGDWSRVCGPTPTSRLGLTAVFLDPPYQIEGRDDVYDNHDAQADGSNSGVFYDVVRWANARGDDPLMRVAVCGYFEDGLFPDTWDCVRWKSRGGYGSQGDGQGRANAGRESIWFSPHCIKPERVMTLWDVLEAAV